MMNTYPETVAQLAANLITTISELRRDGTVAMSRDNLRMLVSMRGISFANANHVERAFDDAVAMIAPKLRGFRIQVSR